MEANDKRLINIINQANKVLDVFQATGDRRQFIALQDQVDSFVDEIWNEDLQKYIDEMR